MKFLSEHVDEKREIALAPKATRRRLPPSRMGDKREGSDREAPSGFQILSLSCPTIAGIVGRLGAGGGSGVATFCFLVWASGF